MKRTFFDDALDLAADLEGEPSQLTLEGVEASEPGELGWPSGSEFELTRGIGLENESSAGGEAGDDPPMHQFAQWVGQMHEDRDDPLPLADADLIDGEIGDRGFDLDAALPGKPARLIQAVRRAVDGGHLESLPGQEYGIAPLALADAEDAPPRDAGNLGFQEVVRFASVGVVGGGVTLLPRFN